MLLRIRELFGRLSDLQIHRAPNTQRDFLYIAIEMLEFDQCLFVIKRNHLKHLSLVQVPVPVTNDRVGFVIHNMENNAWRMIRQYVIALIVGWRHRKVRRGRQTE